MARRQALEFNLTERAYLLIREKILKGEYPLGAQLDRRKFAREFGVSILPIAEALQRLQNDGLVDSRPRVGTCVHVPTPAEIRGHYVVREALETQAARLFCDKATPEERVRARELAAAVDELYNRSTAADAPSKLVYEANVRHLELHMYIAECARCPELQCAIEKAHVLIFNWLYHSSVRFALPPKWHTELIDAIGGSDRLAADSAMRHHVNYGLGTLLQRLQKSITDCSSSLVRSLARPTVRTA